APIFQVMFAWQNTPEGKIDVPGLTASPLAAPQVTSQFDLSLELEETNQRIVGVVEYATSLFDQATVQRYLGYWRMLLEGMVEDEGKGVDSLAVVGQAERRQVLVEWNATEADYPAARSRQEKCVHELFEAQVEKSPEAIALVHKEQSLTYRELNVRANRLAH